MFYSVTNEDRLSFLSVNGFSPVVLNLIGRTYPSAAYHISRRDFPYYIFEYIISGKGKLRVENEHYVPEAGDVYIIPANTDHEYFSDPDDPWDKLWFNIGGSLIQSMLSCYGIHGVVLFKHVPQKIRHLFEEGIATLQESPVNCLKLAPMILLNIIIELAEHHRNMEQNISPDAAEIRDLLLLNISNPDFSISDMEPRIHYSRSQILRIFEQSFKESPYQYLLNQRIECAKLLLKDPTKTVKHTALSLGFSDVFHFSKIFKKKTGLSPMEYRRSALVEQRKELVFTQPKVNSDTQENGNKK